MPIIVVDIAQFSRIRAAEESRDHLTDSLRFDASGNEKPQTDK
jgi:hypothetical protein